MGQQLFLSLVDFTKIFLVALGMCDYRCEVALASICAALERYWYTSPRAYIRLRRRGHATPMHSDCTNVEIFQCY